MSKPDLIAISVFAKTLSNIGRLRVLMYLLDADGRYVPYAEIREAFPAVSQALLSQMLRYLQECGYVVPRKDGNRVSYAITSHKQVLLIKKLTEQEMFQEKGE